MGDLSIDTSSFKDYNGYIIRREGTAMASVSYKVYENEDNKAVYIGDVTASNYEEAVAFLVSEGLDESNFILTRKDD